MFNLTVEYHWFKGCNKKRQIFKVYKINGVPYTFDHLSKIEQQNPEVITLADSNKEIDQYYLWYGSYYLISENVHPLIFDVEIDHPELLPVD